MAAAAREGGSAAGPARFTAQTREIDWSPEFSAALERSQAISAFLGRKFPRVANFAEESSQERRRRLATAMSLFCIAFEHHFAITRLMEMNLRTSAFALVRSTVDANLRGAWVAWAATEQAFEHFRAGREGNARSMYSQLKARKDVQAMFTDSINVGWGHLSEFTHGSSAQISGWFDVAKITERHSDPLAAFMLRAADAEAVHAILLAWDLTETGNDRDLAELNDLLATYAPASQDASSSAPLDSPDPSAG